MNPIITKPNNSISETANELIQLNNRKDIVINIADKNMGFIIKNTTWYVPKIIPSATYIEICNFD